MNYIWITYELHTITYILHTPYIWFTYKLHTFDVCYICYIWIDYICYICSTYNLHMKNVLHISYIHSTLWSMKHLFVSIDLLPFLRVQRRSTAARAQAGDPLARQGSGWGQESGKARASCVGQGNWQDTNDYRRCLPLSNKTGSDCTANPWRWPPWYWQE